MNDTTARQNLFAGIVTFNPDIELLRKNIEAICAQVDLVIIVDNGSRNLEDIRPLADAHHCKLIPNAQNEGIATALNQIALAGKGDGYSWMLTLDQDSECPPDFCSTLSQFFSIPESLSLLQLYKIVIGALSDTNPQVHTGKCEHASHLAHALVSLLGKKSEVLTRSCLSIASISISAIVYVKLDM